MQWIGMDGQYFLSMYFWLTSCVALIVSFAAVIWMSENEHEGE